jgi:hypothetical protein
MTHELIRSWKKASLNVPPYIFPKDNAILSNKTMKTFLSLDDYVTSPEFGMQSDRSLHLGLLPIPYIGCLEKASIFILMLNPGFSPTNYFSEQNSQEYKKAHMHTLRQENTKDDYPFIFLDPKFSWHPGFEYWQKKLQTIIEAYAKQAQITYQQALKFISQKLACLELFPYPSKTFGATAILDILPSTTLMLKYTQEIIKPKARNDEVVVIVARGAKYWNLIGHNIFPYGTAEARAAHLSLESRGGQIIARHLGI